MVQLIYPSTMMLHNCRNCQFKEKLRLILSKHGGVSNHLICKHPLRGKAITPDTNACRHWTCLWPGKIVNENHIEKWIEINHQGRIFRINPYGEIVD